MIKVMFYHLRLAILAVLHPHTLTSIIPEPPTLVAYWLSSDAWVAPSIPSIQLPTDCKPRSFLSAACHVGLGRRPFTGPLLLDDAAILNSVIKAHHGHTRCTRFLVSFPCYATQWNGGVATFRAAAFCSIYHPSCPPLPALTHELSCQVVTQSKSCLILKALHRPGPTHSACPLRHLRGQTGMWQQPWKRVGSYLDLPVMWLSHKLPSIQQLPLSWQCRQGMPLAFAPPAVPPCGMTDPPQSIRFMSPIFNVFFFLTGYT